MDTASDWPPVQYFTMGLNEWQTAESHGRQDDSESLELYLAPGPSDTADVAERRTPHGSATFRRRRRQATSYDPADPVRTLGGSMIGYPWYGPEYEAFSGPFDQRPVEPRCLTYTGEAVGTRHRGDPGRLEQRCYAVILRARHRLGRPAIRRLSRRRSPPGRRGHPQGSLPGIASRGTPHETRRCVRSPGRSMVDEQPVPQGPPHQGPGDE